MIRISIAVALFAVVYPADAVSKDCEKLVSFAERADATLALDGAAFCGTSVRPGGAAARHCAWAYPYRAPQATMAAETLGQRVKRCLDALPDGTPDTRVNHPDSYDLKRWRSGKRVITLSVKDKAARRETFVFLTVTDPLPDQ